MIVHAILTDGPTLLPSARVGSHSQTQISHRQTSLSMPTPASLLPSGRWPGGRDLPRQETISPVRGYSGQWSERRQDLRTLHKEYWGTAGMYVCTLWYPPFIHLVILWKCSYSLIVVAKERVMQCFLALYYASVTWPHFLYSYIETPLFHVHVWLPPPTVLCMTQRPAYLLSIV